MKLRKNRLKWWGIIPIIGHDVDELDGETYNLEVMSYRLFKFEFPEYSEEFEGLGLSDDEFVYIVSDSQIRTVGIDYSHYKKRYMEG